jgi:hypothetical protein
MKSHWRELTALLPLSIEKKVYSKYFNSLYEEWEKSDKTFPPPHLIKQKMIKRYAVEGNHSVLVETGTYLGDMVFAMQDVFQQIYSIELSHHFYQKAVKRFRSYRHIKILEGDSGKVLKKLLPTLNVPALFWLDGHYSGGKTAKGEKECPIFEEIHSILYSPLDHTILIDDARLFVGTNDYPSIEELRQYVISIKPKSNFHFENDAIIITPK